jgi:hypothetical protein
MKNSIGLVKLSIPFSSRIENENNLERFVEDGYRLSAGASRSIIL